MKKINPYLAFLGLMATSFVMFFIAIALHGPASDLLLYMNDPEKQKPIREWLNFLFMALLGSAAWCSLWLIFKKCEKVCIDHMSEN